MDTRLKAFSESEQGVLVRRELLKMAISKKYTTASSYTIHDPNGLSFVDKQMKYMSQYPNMNHAQYISNLKLKTKRSE